VLLNASSAIDADEAAEIAAEAERCLHDAIRAGRLAESLDVVRGRMAEGQIGLDEAIVGLALADRPWDVASLIGERLALPAAGVLALLASRFDFGPAVLAAPAELGGPAQAALHQLRLRRRWRAAELGRGGADLVAGLSRDDADAILAALRGMLGEPGARAA
jgi:hypothetical protein